jgi:hypothetical protein
LICDDSYSLTLKVVSQLSRGHDDCVCYFLQLRIKRFSSQKGLRKWSTLGSAWAFLLCKISDFHRKPESLYHRDSPCISGYRAQNVS